MSDSLRDQLLQAGFKQKKNEPAAKKPRKSKPSRPRANSQTNSRGGSQAESRANPLASKSASPRTSTGTGHHSAKQPNSRSTHQAASATNKPSQRSLGKSHSTVDEAAIEQRRAVKAQIKTLIEANAIKEFAGENVYRFTLQNRIRELHVAEPIRQQLVDNQLIITRLNGTTYLVPESISEQIRELNPNWAVVTPTAATSDSVEGYDDFPIPDDIIW